MVGSDGEGALEGHAYLAKQAFVEQAADQSDAMGNAAWRGKLRQRIFRVRRPVGARLANFDETSAKRERRMAGVVADGEHFVAKGWNEEQIHVGENARHFLAHLATEAIGLNEIHRR